MSTSGGPAQLPEPGSIRCPRCSSAIGPEQDWCLECGAPARTRLAPTPNWQLPTVAIGAMIALAGALLAFAFVKLTGDDGAPVGATPTAVVDTSATAPTTPTPGAKSGTAATARKRRSSATTASAARATKTAAEQASGSVSAARTPAAPKARASETAKRSRTTITSHGLIPANVPKPPP